MALGWKPMLITASAVVLVLVASLSSAARPSPRSLEIRRSSKPPVQVRPATSQIEAAAYYHYTLAHMYEERVALYGSAEFANRADGRVPASH